MNGSHPTTSKTAKKIDPPHGVTNQERTVKDGDAVGKDRMDHDPTQQIDDDGFYSISNRNSFKICVKRSNRCERTRRSRLVKKHEACSNHSNSNYLRRLLIIWLTCATGIHGQTHHNVHLGFPDAWDGDRYSLLYCPSKNIPEFLDGYFLCQLSAAYGEPNAPAGHRLTHMIDAIGAVGSFYIHGGEVTFMAQYYPARPYKIWEFYDRNMSLASVPWVGWSDYNVTAVNAWERVAGTPNAARFHPNLNFWRVGRRVLAGTEAAYWVGYEFDVMTLNNFTLFEFVERNDVFGRPSPSLVPISMAIHERTDASDGTLWGTFSAMNFNKHQFYQGIFTVDAEGVRRVLGMYEYGYWDPSACADHDEYIGDKTQLAGYVHSITSTENYIILPITSLLINPCKLKEPPITNSNSPIQNGGLWGMDFYEMMPARFLVFDKRKRVWRTEKPLEVFPSMFITHQLNAYEDNSYIIADMIVYDNHDPYVKFFYSDFLTSQTYPSVARILRFTIDVYEMKIIYNYLVPENTISAEFPQINHVYDDRRYEWAYIVEHPFAAENAIVKLNVDNPGGQKNQRFRPAGPDVQLVLHEPWFVARPDPISEDDGVLLIRALDLNENKGILLIIDAITMLEVGRAIVPISVPFGFHNRFFARVDLGLPSESPLVAHRFKSLKRGRTENSVVDSVDDTRRLFRPNMWWKNGGTIADCPGYWPQEVLSTTTTVRPSWIYVDVKTSTVPTISASEWTLQTRKLPTLPDPIGSGASSSNQQISPNMTKLQLRRLWPDHGSRALVSYRQTSSENSELNRISALSLSKLLATQRPITDEDLSARRLVITQSLERSRPVTNKEEALSSITIISSQSGGYNRVGGSMATDSALREIYDKSLRALCRWLPKILENITVEGCVQVNDRTKNTWMRPSRVDASIENTETVASRNLFNPEDRKTKLGLGKALALSKPSNFIRPVLKPVYSLKETGSYYGNYQQP